MMYRTCYSIYFLLMRERKRKIQSNSKDIVLYKKICDRIEWYYNCIVTKSFTNHKSSSPGVTKIKRDQQLIVSLTSFPKRINTIWITIETLLRQSVKPDRIILWLAENQFQGMESIPKSLIALKERGLEIRFCDDLRSHKKYFYVMQEFPTALIMLADDDMFYPSDTIQKLLKMHEHYPKNICTMTAQVIEKDLYSVPSMWRNPRIGEILENSDRIQVFTGSGSLYPPGALSKLAFDIEAIQSTCPYADDLWITFMALINGTRITTSRKWRAFPVSIYGTSADSLWFINAEGGQNDIQWKAILKAYKEELEKWEKS